MKGSEKQIKWAEDIRAKALAHITEENAMAYAEKEDEKLDMDLLREYRKKIETCEDAKFFIDIVRHYSDDSAFYWMEKDDDDWEVAARGTLGL